MEFILETDRFNWVSNSTNPDLEINYCYVESKK
jgi:hypothetical protein